MQERATVHGECAPLEGQLCLFALPELEIGGGPDAIEEREDDETNVGEQLERELK